MGQRITGLRLPANIMFTNGATSVTVGSHFATGFSMDGIVESLERDGDAVVLTFEKTGQQVLLFGSGMLAEIQPAKPKEKGK